MSSELPTNDDFTAHDWDEVFPSTGDTWTSGDYSGTFAAVAGGGGARVNDVTKARIADVLAFDAYSPEGGGGSLDAVAVVQLTDGTFAALTAYADYTGWGCQADAQWRWARTKGDVIRYGLDNEGRNRLGFTLHPVSSGSSVETGQSR